MSTETAFDWNYAYRPTQHFIGILPAETFHCNYADQRKLIGKYAYRRELITKYGDPQDIFHDKVDSDVFFRDKSARQGILAQFGSWL